MHNLAQTKNQFLLRELEVYDSFQNLKEKKNKLKGKSTKIKTHSWKKGIYTIRVKYKDKILTSKLMVNK